MYKIFLYTSQYTSIGLCLLTKIYTIYIYIHIYRHIQYIYIYWKANRFSVAQNHNGKREGLIERAKGINATLIEAVLADCDMLTQLCRKYNASLINLVYLTEREKQNVRIPKRDHFVIPSRHF